MNQNFLAFLLFILLPVIHGDFEDSILDEHNRYRAKHNTPKLTLDSGLSSGCASYAKEIAAKNSLDHSSGNYGENLCMRSSDPVQCVKMWYDEIKDYDYKNPKFSAATGHFTQVIWKSSKKMGVGKAKSSSGAYYVVARYTPAGNVVGKFKENVLPLSGTKPECSYLIMLLAKHKTPKLTLNADLTSGCASYAKEIADKNKLEYSKGNYGENLCMTSSNPVECVKTWYDEIKDYDFRHHRFSFGTGHFTQVVWKSSKELGVGKAKSSKGATYVVARYTPAGNIDGKYKENRHDARMFLLDNVILGDLILIQIICCALLLCLPAIHASVEEDVLERHNSYREKHNSPALTLNSRLSRECADYAKEIAQKDVLKPSGENWYGESLCRTTYDPTTCVRDWYNEIKEYDYDNPKLSKETEHFTQLVWKSTEELGVGVAKGARGDSFVVARYVPPGNVPGYFEDNVPIKGRSTRPTHSIALIICIAIASLLNIAFLL
ncbi:uncharacterized protein LOC115623894 [Scaptodrosophila lebanonensis]|uniref:Uncharacterized protein LOC115623894 n=1 Tax=Drosophila lebanonensis TaxID=7225 RepID=A0A6J2TBY6_DROLE|nr:uncharacterized protein LOC115623894 [Scaptodrosophila lebanonensis]